MSGSRHYDNGARWHKCRARVKARHDPCALCGGAIDYSLRTPDPMSFEVDHIIPVSKGGAVYDMRNLQAVHRRCNRAKSNSLIKQKSSDKIDTSRRW